MEINIEIKNKNKVVLVEVPAQNSQEASKLADMFDAKDCFKVFERSYKNGIAKLHMHTIPGLFTHDKIHQTIEEYESNQNSN